ncbi:CLUMA_CG010529, isoform A [Clunio marinus]|uniref:CLUMA_CG010529, isoform A n=1 Tax=Clunio marinus TaxID=568069 RepID=A0A1J1IC48_9DIPT|nr:CLUMA_CG010529, isoform A [Clunio marinus]
MLNKWFRGNKILYRSVTSTEVTNNFVCQNQFLNFIQQRITLRDMILKIGWILPQVTVTNGQIFCRCEINHLRIFHEQ